MFKKQDLNTFSFPVFQKFSSPGALLSAGTIGNHNTMAIGWGNLGILWSKRVAIVYVRPSRHTFSFMESQSYFSINFFDDKTIIDFYGNVSGRDVEKDKESKLSVIKLDESIGYSDANTVITCRKIYSDEMKSDLILDAESKSRYEEKDVHHLYIGEIINIYQKETK